MTPTNKTRYTSLTSKKEATKRSDQRNRKDEALRHGITHRSQPTPPLAMTATWGGVGPLAPPRARRAHVGAISRIFLIEVDLDSRTTTVSDDTGCAVIEDLHLLAVRCWGTWNATLLDFDDIIKTWQFLIVIAHVRSHNIGSIVRPCACRACSRRRTGQGRGCVRARDFDNGRSSGERRRGRCRRGRRFG